MEGIRELHKLLNSLCMGLAMCLAAAAWGQQNPHGLALPGTAKITDRFEPLKPSETDLNGGMLGRRIAVSEKDRLLVVDENDLLDCFERRNVPHQDWQGEHVGKFLHAATLAWAETGDKALKAKIDRVVARLLQTQEADGYLGTYPRSRRWTSWDVWVHKYVLLGLLAYYQFAHYRPALLACTRVGDLLTQTFGPGLRDINAAGEQVGMAADSVLEPIVLLYRATNNAAYLKFAKYIVSNYDSPRGPAILTSLEKYRSVRRVANAKAYEMESNFNGLLELYRVTGSQRLLSDVQIAWADIVKNRLYITGGASSYEVFQDEYLLPDGEGANICETCVTVTWEQVNLQLLRLSGDPRYADQAERAVYNHLLGAQKPTGDEWSYYTPLYGHKPYSSTTTCCLSSGPRGVALIPSVAYMKSDDGGLVINLYNRGAATTVLPSGRVTVSQQTDYPLSGHVTITVRPAAASARFPLRLRIPGWTDRAVIRINGRPVPGLPVTPGTYAVIARTWRPGDTVSMDIHLPVRLVVGDHENAGKNAVTRGPLVLAYDAAHNLGVPSMPLVELAANNARGLKLAAAPSHSTAGELVFQSYGLVGPAHRPAYIYLTPFASAGADGVSRFEVWIPRRRSAPYAAASLFLGGAMSTSRPGNVMGDIADGDPSSFAVTYTGTAADLDWFQVSIARPITIDRVVFYSGRRFHDGGWFDTDGGKAPPVVEVESRTGGPWAKVGTLAAYPATIATDSANLQDGQRFETRILPVEVIAIRVVGKPACGDNPNQAFSSCGDLDAFGPQNSAVRN